MRISVDDKCFDTGAYENASIYLDGKKMNDVLMADTDLGVIEVYSKDAYGYIPNQGELEREKLFGEVTITGVAFINSPSQTPADEAP